jgi:hypothetical protein
MAGGAPRGRKGSSPPQPAKSSAPGRRTVEPARLGLTPRRSAAAARSEAAQSLQRFVRQDYWNGLAAGDVVRVAGHTPRGRHWRFRAHVTNTSNGAAWVEVALVEGPPPSKRPAPRSSTGAADEPLEVPAGLRVDQVRSFDPALVTPRWRGRGRVASLLRPSAGARTANPAQVEPSQAMSQQTSLF